jgi:LacI family transcriptional regulator, repressor for deo operon, udp, cdd, tsx, nupC, and nupG
MSEDDGVTIRVSPNAAARPRMKEVAALAGVSVATVSRALAGSPLVTADTREAVENAVRQAGYTLNQAGRGLRLQVSHRILILLPTLSNPFFAEIVQGLDEKAQKSGFSVLVGSTEGSLEREDRLARQLLSGAADGLVLLTGRMPHALRGPAAATHQIVAVSEQVPDSTVPLVGIDNKSAAHDATRHLIDLGHRRIAHIAGPRGNILTRLRIAGYRAALREKGLAFDPGLVVGSDFTAEAGSRAMQNLLERAPRPTAVFCANDDTALGAISVAKQAGLAVPADLSVVGFDDISYAAFSDPPLTTIRQPRRRFGQLAAAILLDEMPAKGAVTLPYEMVLRRSTGTPRRR